MFGLESFPAVENNNEQMEKARAIIQEGGYDHILSRLEEEDLLDVVIEEPNIVFRPLGSTRPIVVVGPLQGEDGIYNIKTIK